MRGRTAPRGKPPGVIDRTEARAALRARAESEALALHTARAALAARTPCALSELPELDSPGFEVLLDAIGEAFALMGPEDLQGEALTADGGLAVQITLPAPRAALVALRTEEGVLHGPDLRLELRLTDTDTAS